MKTNKRTRSISRKINSRSISKMFLVFLLMNMLIIGMACSLWCISVEYSESGSLQDNSGRCFLEIDKLQEKHPEFKKTEAYKDYKDAKELHNTIGLSGGKFVDDLKTSFYVFKDSDSNFRYVYSGTFFVMLSCGMIALIVIQLIILFVSILLGPRKIRRDLTPLDELALKAELLGKASSFDQQALDELEAAINRISPSGDGASLHTNNAELAELEIAINGLLERMRETYRQQTRFVSDASHELRTPIAVLQGYVNMLDRWGKEDEQILDESIEAIKSETEHMKKLVEQLLFLARGDSGKTKLTMEAFPLNNMMKEVYEESVMIDSSHQYNFMACLENPIITGDISMLKQTARILIDNAAKYAPSDSEIKISTMLDDAGQPAFVIQDEGIGMSTSDASHIFERFYRSDPARTKDSGGSGLGLSIAKWIVDRHSGYFEVLSREDIGTRITVHLPQKNI